MLRRRFCQENWESISKLKSPAKTMQTLAHAGDLFRHEDFLRDKFCTHSPTADEPTCTCTAHDTKRTKFLTRKRRKIADKQRILLCKSVWCSRGHQRHIYAGTRSWLHFTSALRLKTFHGQTQENDERGSVLVRLVLWIIHQGFTAHLSTNLLTVHF